MMDLFAPCMSLQATLCEGGMMRMRFDLCLSQSVACRLVTEPSEISFAPSTPPIYNSYTLLEPTGQVGTLTFVSRPNNAYRRLFLATLTSSSIAGLCREIIFLLWNDIELSWKLHLVKYLFQIFTYKYGIVVTF